MLYKFEMNKKGRIEMKKLLVLSAIAAAFSANVQAQEQPKKMKSGLLVLLNIIQLTKLKLDCLIF